LTAATQNAKLVKDPWEDQIAALLVQAQQTPAISMMGGVHHFIASATMLAGLGVPGASAFPGHYMLISSIIKKHFPQWEKTLYSNTQKPLSVCGTLQTSVRGYRLLTAGTQTAGNVIPINP
jgi:hypothetical protein